MTLLWALLVTAPAQQPPVNQLPHPTDAWTPPPPARRGPFLATPTPSTPALNSSSWTAIGPAPLQFGISFSGRITGIAADPSNANIIYIAAAGGGVWKTINGGSTWSPLTDGQVTLSMGAIAIAPSDPSVIYAGTGEANNSGDSNYGRGILISTDGGTNWTLSTGLAANTDRLTISQIAVDPSNSSVAYVATSGIGNNTDCCSSPNAIGIWKTTDGGASWTNMTALNGLTVGPWTAVVVDPNNSQVVYAAVGLFFGQPGNGVYKSTNGGVSWTLLTNGPTGTLTGRIALALAPSNSQVLYILASAAFPTPGVYKVMRSDDGGATFTDLTAGTPNFVDDQGWYDLVVAVDPTTPSTVYVGGAAPQVVGLGGGVLWSPDSGAHWLPMDVFGSGLVAPHADHHAFAFDANGRLLDGDDGGIFRLDNLVPTLWSDLNGDLNTIQFYGIGLHPTNSSIAIGGSQDNGTELYSGSPSWIEEEGGDAGFAKVSQQDGNLMYHQIPVPSFGSNFFRVSTDGGLTWNTATSGIAADLSFQNFIAPFVVDPNDGTRVLYGTNRVWETTTAGALWTPISNIGVGGWNSDAAVFVDAIGLAQSDVNTIYAAESPPQFPGPVVFVTTDHGITWTEHEIIPLGFRVGDLQVDPIDSRTAYAVIKEFSSIGNVFRTTDGGATWTNISGDLPNEPASSLQIDSTTTPHTLYVGADDGVYVSTNLGVSWTRFGMGLPNAQVYQVALNDKLHILAAGTHGRGMWEIMTVSGRAATSTSLISSANPSALGRPLTFTAEVNSASSGTPTGTVTFKDGDTTVGTETLSDGKARFTTSRLEIGTHAITAIYTGDDNFYGSTSEGLTQTVTRAETSTIGSSSLNLSRHGNPITFTATVDSFSPGTPTGSVTIKDGDITIGTEMLRDGKARFTTSTLQVGTHEITAIYSGDANFTGSVSDVLREIVIDAEDSNKTSFPRGAVRRKKRVRAPDFGVHYRTENPAVTLQKHKLWGVRQR